MAIFQGLHETRFPGTWGRLWWLGLKLRISDHHQVTSLVCASHDLYGAVSREHAHMKPINGLTFRSLGFIHVIALDLSGQIEYSDSLI